MTEADAGVAPNPGASTAGGPSPGAAAPAPIGTEIEIKLTGTPETLRRVPRHRALAALGHGKPRARLLNATYYDTPDHALKALGIALRVRRVDRRWIQTVKRRPTRNQGLPAPETQEHEAVTRSGLPSVDLLPEGALRDLVEPILARADFGPIFQTRVRRVSRDVSTRDGGLVEIAVDLGAIIASGRQAAIAEVEIELKEGRPEALYEIAIDLIESLPLTLAFENKAHRGYRLLTETDLGPSKAKAPELVADARVEDALAATLRAGLSHLSLNVAAFLETGRPETVHQMRVALRRLRAAFAIFRDLVRAPLSDDLRQRLKRFADLLGAARDLDVFLAETAIPAAAGLGPDPRLDQLCRAAEGARLSAYGRARAALTDKAWSRLALDLGHYVESRSWRLAPAADLGVFDGPVDAFAAKVLDARWRKALKSAADLESLVGDDRHALRIELKKLRYGADFFGSLYPRKAARSYMAALAVLQERLGLLNDVHVARGLVDDLITATPARGRAGLAYAGGLVVGWRARAAAREWKRVVRAWPAFARRAPFWRER